MTVTEVQVHFNGATNYYYFLTDKKSFMETWDNQINAVGFYAGEDRYSDYIVVNPSCCGGVVITEREMEK